MIVWVWDCVGVGLCGCGCGIMQKQEKCILLRGNEKPHILTTQMNSVGVLS